MYLFLTWSINWGIHRFCYWNLSLSLTTTCSFLGTLDSFWHSLFFNFSCRAIINVSPSISNWRRGIILCKLLLTWEIWRSHLFSISHYSLMDWWVCPFILWTWLGISCYYTSISWPLWLFLCHSTLKILLFRILPLWARSSIMTFSVCMYVGLWVKLSISWSPVLYTPAFCTYKTKSNISSCPSWCRK